MASTSKEALDILNNFIPREKHIDSERNKKIKEYYELIKKDLDLLEKIMNKDTRINVTNVLIEYDYKDRAMYYTGVCPLCGEETTVLAWDDDEESRCSGCNQLLLFKTKPTDTIRAKRGDNK